MIKKTILLIEDNAKVVSTLREMLGRAHKIEVVQGYDAAAAWMKKNNPDLIVIDFDLKAEDGLQVFKKIHPIRPGVRVIMLSVSGDIPLAVSATKCGVSEFLRKPLNADQVNETVARNISGPGRKLSVPRNIGWLCGESLALNKMLESIHAHAQENSDLFLIGERGIDKQAVAQIFHDNGFRSQRKLVVLDMGRFRKKALETNFWTVLQDVMAMPNPSSLREEEDLCGTLYFDNFESLGGDFRASLLAFLKEPRGKIDRSIRVIFGVDGPLGIKGENMQAVTIPSLRQRKEDLPAILAFLLNDFSRKYNKDVRHVSLEFLEFIMSYDYPGNYLELERMIEEAVLNAKSSLLELRDIPFNLGKLLQGMLKKGQGHGLNLAEAKKEFEKKLYSVSLDKLDGNHAAAARFFDVPKAVFMKRMEDLQNGL